MLNKLRLLTPGPTPLPEEVRLALAKDMLHHRKADFHAIMAQVEDGLQTLFGTKEVVLPLACSGTGAMTAAVYSLFAPNEQVLVVNAGKFGERWVKIAQSRGLDPVVLNLEWGSACTREQVEEALLKNPNIKGVLLQVSETSTGVLHPVAEIAKLTCERDVLLVADGISALGISPCPMDELGLDCLLTGSQKGLFLPPGLALLALSKRAWDKAEKITPGCFYFNLPAERAKLLKNETNFTSPVNLIVGLEAGLKLLLAKGLKEVYRKQWALTMLTRAAVQALGLELLAKEHFTWGLTSILLPKGIDGQKVLSWAEKNYGVCLAGGQDQLKGRLVRLGHMGWVDYGDVLAGLYALEQAILAQGGFTAARDYLEVGLAAYREALKGEIGQVVPKVLVRS
ncbi:MAG: alanine--glyoxylate aminotransferase family protein [Desulfovibrio sp.]|nr:alanine--glyoxylate aminotransferase family protein [Desulfovibrio sp.]